MRKYIIKRLLLAVIIFFFVMLIIYTVLRCLPSSYVETIAREKSQQPGSKSYQEWLDQLNAMYGLDKGIIPGYIGWLGEFFTGHFGDSWKYTVPVIDKFNEVVWLSFEMGVITMILELIIAIPLGIIAATKQYSKTDYTISILALAFISLPTFFFIALLKLVFCVKIQIPDPTTGSMMGLFPLTGLFSRTYNQMTPVQQFFDRAWHLVLPITTLVIISIGGLMRYTRTNMLEVLNADYIRTARAKGLSEKKVIYHHAFRNTLIPLVTIVGGSLPGLFSGALFTETMFSLPGIGYISYNAMIGGDIPFSMFYLAFLAILTLLGNLIADILYAVVDPRVRLA